MPFANLVVSGNTNPSLAKTLAEGVHERTARILRKNPDIAAVTVSFVPSTQWLVGGRPLAELGLASFWLDVKLTLDTNTKAEKAAYIADVFAFMRAELGPLHEGSYVLVHEIPADAWGYNGLTQEQRRTNDASRSL